MTNHDEDKWLSVPEVSDLLGARLRDVRAMVASNEFLAVRRGESQVLAIHRDQLVDDDGRWEALPSLRGTITTLKDAGLTDEEALTWLLEGNDDLGEAPLHALRNGRVHVVRRLSRTLAL